MYQDLYNYLIDTKIKIDDNDSLLTKFQKILLKYKKIIALILLIILIIIGYLCKIHNLYLNNHEHEHTCILNGGFKVNYKSTYKAKIAKGASQRASTVASAFNPTNIKAFGDRRAEDAKDLAPWFYDILYSVSIALLSFLIFIPAIGFIVVGLICYVLLKDKISYIKSL
jgi:hypothetical protein